MSPNDRFKINSSKIVHDAIDGEVIIINFDTGVYYSLNAVCKEVWSSIEKNSAFAEIVNEIGNKYLGNIEDFEQAVSQLLIDLEKEELIISDKSESDSSLQISREPESGKEKMKFEKPVFRKYTDMKEMLLLDPIHEVDETGWPATKAPIIKKD